jgi:hypothetical protein
MVNEAKFNLMAMLICSGLWSACGAKSTSTSVESSDARSTQLRDSFQCHALPMEHQFDRSSSALIYSFQSPATSPVQSLSLYGNGRVVAHREKVGSEANDVSQTLSVSDLNSLLFELVDRFCLLSITEESIKAKVKTINAAYEAAHPGKASYGKARINDCGAPKISMALDGKAYSGVFDSCNDFNTFIESGSTVAEEKFVSEAQRAALQYLDSMLQPAK